MWTGWMPLSEYWTPPECYWVHMNTFEWLWTAPEHTLSMHECQWVSVNSLWTPLRVHECHWVSVNTHWVCVDAIGYHLKWLIVVWPWKRMHLCENWTAHKRNWLCVNTFEWVLNMPWMLLSVCECLWVSIEQPLNTHWVNIWMPLSKYLEGLDVHL